MKTLIYQKTYVSATQKKMKHRHQFFFYTPNRSISVSLLYQTHTILFSSVLSKMENKKPSRNKARKFESRNAVIVLLDVE